MELSKFSPSDKKEILLLNIAKSILDVVDNTHAKPQETLEFKMNKQSESFSFNIPLELPEKWMMGVTSLEVYNTVYNITSKNNSIQIQLTDEQIEKVGIDTQLAMNIEYLHKSKQPNFIQNVYDFLNASYEKKKKLSKNDLEKIKEIVGGIKKEEWIDIDETTKTLVNTIEVPPFEIIDLPITNDFLEIVIEPGIYELTDINIAIQNKIKEFKIPNLSFNIKANDVLMKSILTTSNSIHFNSELNALLGFTNKFYPAGTLTSEKPVMITTTDKVHLKCDCVDGSIVNGIREQILFSFNLSAPPGYKIIKEPTTVLYKKINKARLDEIKFYLEDSNYNPVDFNSETLTFTIQIIKI